MAAVQRFDLAVSEPLDVRVTLRPEPAVPIEPTGAAGASPSPAPARPLRILGISALGAGGLALGGALVYEMLRRDAQHDAENEHVQIRLADDLDKIQSRRTAARVLGGLGAGLAAAGAILLIVNPSDPPTQDLTAQVKVAVMPSSVTGAVFGRF
jgi:hypothetical protein